MSGAALAALLCLLATASGADLLCKDCGPLKDEAAVFPNDFSGSSESPSFLPSPVEPSPTPAETPATSSSSSGAVSPTPGGQSTHYDPTSTISSSTAPPTSSTGIISTSQQTASGTPSHSTSLPTPPTSHSTSLPPILPSQSSPPAPSPPLCPTETPGTREKCNKDCEDCMRKISIAVGTSIPASILVTILAMIPLCLCCQKKKNKSTYIRMAPTVYFDEDEN